MDWGEGGGWSFVVLKRDIGSTFSEVWYRLEGRRPRISPHTRFVRRARGRHVYYIVEEPASGSYYRLTEPAYRFCALLDGRRSIGEAWDACNAQLGDDAPTQRECVDVLAKLRLFGLLIGELPIEATMSAERRLQVRKRRWQKRTGKYIFPSVRILNPEPFLERHAGVWRALFSRWGFAVWCLLMLVAVVGLARNADELFVPINDMLEPRTLAVLGVVFLVLRALHEFGHAAACKAFGGRVTEIGLIMIAYVLPLPYCDASSAWKFPSLLHRVAVSMGGILAEMSVAAVAAIVWAMTLGADELLWLRTLCYQVMLVASVTTFLFNLNPLLRYDGYYILSDVLDAPNLAQRSQELFKAGMTRLLFGSRGEPIPAVRDRSEMIALWVFAAFSTPYRLFILFAIALVIATAYPALGLILAAVFIVMLMLWPALKAVAYVASSPKLSGHRPRAVAVSLGLVVVVVGAVGYVPVPSAVYASGVVREAEPAVVRADESGFVHEVTEDGEGRPTIVLVNDDVAANLYIANARRDWARALVDMAVHVPPGERLFAEKMLELQNAEHERYVERYGALRVVSPVAGKLALSNPEVLTPDDLHGRWVARGTELGRVVQSRAFVVRAAIPEHEAALALARRGGTLGGPRHGVTGGDGVRNGDDRPVEIRVRGRAGEVVGGSIVREGAAATQELLDAALDSRAGGDIFVNQSEQSGSRTVVPHLLVEVQPTAAPEWWQPGLRARVRIPLDPEPLGAKGVRWVRRLMREVIG